MSLRLSEAKVVGELGKQLVEWLKLDCEYFGRAKKVLLNGDDAKHFSIQIFMPKNCYHIIARMGDHLKDYLGCTVVSRTPRPGETWNRGKDLPDGRFSKETLNRILCAIVFFEARIVVKDIKQAEDCVEEKQSKD